MSEYRPFSILKDYKTTASMRENLLALLAYFVCVVSLVGILPADLFDPSSHKFLFIVGTLTIWRYLWGLNHLVRALYYQHAVYPRWRMAAQKKNWRPPHLYLVIPSYRIEEKITDVVISSVINALKSYDVPATMVVSVATDWEKEIVENIFVDLREESPIELILMIQDGTGKRTAMGEALRAITRRSPNPDSIVCLMDGDTALTPDIFNKTIYHFGIMNNLGALTTDNIPATKGTGIVREWYYLRMAQRHLYMSSLALSKKVLCLTGRFSLFRGKIVFQDSFIDMLVHDEITHWRHGKLEMLTGEDKTTWFYVLREGYDMIYCPDARAIPIEELPPGGFFRASEQLMFRWFGNMLRNNGRAIALGPRRAGKFLWRCLIDQRISIWTSLSGPFAAILGSFAFSHEFFLAYILWVLVSRLWHSAIVFLMRGRFSPYFIPLIFYSQVFGALMKVYVRFRLNRQKWIRQNLEQTVHYRYDWGAIYLNTAAIIAFLICVAFLMGIAKVDIPVGW